MKTTVRRSGNYFELLTYPKEQLIGRARVRDATPSELRASNRRTTRGKHVEVFTPNGVLIGTSVSQVLNEKKAAKIAMSFHLVHI